MSAPFTTTGAAAGTAIGGPIGTVIGAVAGGILGSLLGPKVDPRIAQYITPAIQRGDTAFLMAWINDQPPHPTDSIIAAQKGLAQLTGSPYSTGGRITSSAPAPTAFTPRGYVPVGYQGGTVNIPFA